ncbi:MAG: hypothetical protein ACRBFS_18215 [Aureispira sp.]
MSSIPKQYFAFPYTSQRYVLGAIQGPWMWFYDCYWEQFAQLPTLEQPNILFVLYEKPLEFLGNYIVLEAQLFEHWVAEEKEAVELYFDEESASFKAASKETVREATVLESLFYVDIIATQQLSLAALKLRLLETTLGFIPSFQYVIEQTYQRFLSSYQQSIATADPLFTSKKRKKAFDQLFKEQLLPFAKKQGLERMTKTSKRLLKQYDNGLSVVFFFEYKNFGLGAYTVSIVYFDAAIGSIADDAYLATIGPSFPYSSNLMMSSQNATILQHDVTNWMRVMELYVLPFMHKNATHQAILNTIKRKEQLDQQRTVLGLSPRAQQAAYYFQLSKSRQEHCLQVLKEKAILYS